MTNEKQKIVVICGPTATGKTELAVNMAKRFNGEIISADSMQIYKQLTIGTAKATETEMQGVKHYLVDFLSPCELFSVVDFVSAAEKAIKEISSKGKLPIIAGGTGLYISSLVNGITFTDEKADMTIRKQLEAEADIYGGEEMLRRLAKIDPEYASKQHPANLKRILRALELYKQTGITMSEQLKNSKPEEKPYNELVIGINYENRALLYSRIEKRIDLMLSNGLLEEARLVYDNRQSFITAAQAIGYKEFFDYFENKKTLTECADLLKQSSRRYAKRQVTWFKKIPDIKWVYKDLTEDANKECEKLIEAFGA